MKNITLVKPEPIFIWGSGEFNALPIRAAVFGHMVEHAMPVLKQYHSDLFHDTLWLTEHMDGPTSFDWLVRASGTDIGDNARVMAGIDHGPDNVLYRVTLACERGFRWTVTFNRMTS